MGRKIHWELCRKYRLAASERWYEHQPETVTENDSCKLLWDFSIQTDHVIQARRPDVIFIDKEKKECKILDFAIPYDSRVNAKEMEKTEKYQDLARDVQKLWNMRTKVIPVVIGALGTTPKELSKRLDDLGIGTRIVELQKTVIIYSSRILRKVLEILGVLLTPCFKPLSPLTKTVCDTINNNTLKFYSAKPNKSYLSLALYNM